MRVNDASRIIMDDSRVMLQIVASFTDDSIGVIHEHNTCLVQATDLDPPNVSREIG